ncbi:hypothetical protein EJB05_10927 [Eragrostis curvula]|uniref:Uncharacterized protein n=1 Tax=Eragrostis curvula TaxID=38414 RepID=A0A5J9VMG3_9POAL|nr:hypothetical protein EJB05_10927 [Eragrostis curvula]
MSDNTATCIDIILAIILPPLGVFFKFGCGTCCRLSSGSAFCSPSSATSPASSTPSGPSPSRAAGTSSHQGDEELSLRVMCRVSRPV